MRPFFQKRREEVTAELSRLRAKARRDKRDVRRQSELETELLKIDRATKVRR